MNVSVIVCTYNRSVALRQLLHSLEAMRVPPHVEWELVVVDNNSDDETPSVIEEFRAKQSLPVKYVFERRQGQSFARNAGIRTSEGTILAFTDDDCIPDKQWVAEIYNEFESHSGLSILGGRVELFDLTDKPVTIVTYTNRREYSPLDDLCFIMGANMSVRRSVIDAVGEFDCNLGRGGPLEAVIEDADFVYRAYTKGFKVAYAPQVMVYHNHGRKSDEELFQVLRGYAIGRGALYCKYILSTDRNMLRIAYWDIRSVLKRFLQNLIALESSYRQVNELVGLYFGIIRMLRVKLSSVKPRRKNSLPN
jgi:glycosyltransferase involved in cell wall biosynthesis